MGNTQSDEDKRNMQRGTSNQIRIKQTFNEVHPIKWGQKEHAMRNIQSDEDNINFQRGTPNHTRTRGTCNEEHPIRWGQEVLALLIACSISAHYQRLLDATQWHGNTMCKDHGSLRLIRQSQMPDTDHWNQSKAYSKVKNSDLLLFLALSSSGSKTGNFTILGTLI